MKWITLTLAAVALFVFHGCGGCGAEIGADGIIDGWPEGSDSMDWFTDEIPSGPCTPGEVICNGPMRMRCNDDQVWVADPCDAGLICTGDGECTDRVCTPGERRCSPTSPDVIEQCNSAGSGWEAVDSCTDRLVCMDGACVVEVCTPGEIRCAGTQYRQCDADGLGWSDPVDCPEGQACNDGACTDIICTPGDGTCTSESTRIVCNATGTEEVEEECMAGYICIDGVCRLQICPPGLVRCVDDLNYEVCNETGTEFISGGSCNAAAGERCIEGECLTACALAELHPSSIGCVFYAADLDQADESSADASPYAIIISNTDSDNAASVVVEDRIGGAWRNRASQTVGPNSLYTFRLSPDQHVEDTNKLAGYAYRVTSDRPVIAYQFNPIDSAGQYTNDASLLLPKSTLDLQYYVSAWPKYPARTYYSNLTVVGTQDGTSVTVTVSVATLGGGGIPALGAGGTTTQTLNEGEVMQIANSGENGDLTGSFVDATAPVAVYGGCECADVPLNCTWCRNYAGTAVSTCHWCDHVEEQMFPLTTWGMRYIAARVPVRSSSGVEASYWKIIASENATTVSFSYATGTAFRSPSGSPPFTLNAGQVLHFEMAGSAAAPGDALIEADKPILVVQYIEGQQCTDRGAGDGGDPAMILMVPVEQYLDKYIFLTPNTYALDYVVVIKPTTASVTMDGAALGGTAFPVTTGWEIRRPTIGDGVHTIEGTEPFGIIGVGYSPYVSYGYMGGLALERINPQD
jgi:hypothetical protein